MSVKQLLLILAMLLLVVSCDPALVITPTPIATPTITTTVTVTETPSVTATASTTATPSITPTPWPTCEPQLTGSVIFQAFVDENSDFQMQAGEVPVVVTGTLGYLGLLPERYPLYWQFVTGPGGVGVLMIPAGVYTMTLLAYQTFTDSHIVPHYNYVQQWVMLSNDDELIVSIPFGWFARPQPTFTLTPTATPNLAPHQCVNYWTNCVPLGQLCGAGRSEDPAGQCGVGFHCCAVTSGALRLPVLLATTPTPTNPCATPYASVSLRCCEGPEYSCRPLMCCGEPLP